MITKEEYEEAQEIVWDYEEQLKLQNVSQCANATVIDLIGMTPQGNQVQYSLQRQLQELRIAATKLGLYDAADFIKPHCG